MFPLVALVLLLYLPTMIHSVWVGLGGPSEASSRPDTVRALHSLLQQLQLAGMLALTWSLGWWTSSTVNLHLELLAIPVGLLAWLLISRVHPYVAPPGPSEPYHVLQGLKRLWPRSRAGKAAIGAMLVLNPLTEELATRGVLVVAVAEASGSPILGLGLGLAVNQLLHAYQGARNLPWHAGFFALTALLALSPLGLGAAITLHLCADLAHVDGRGALAWVRSARRQP